MKKTLLLAAFLVLVLALNACTPVEASLPEPVTYTIEMSEYAFTPEIINLRVGQQVTLNLVNTGQLDHELMIGRDVEIMVGMPMNFHEDFFETGGISPMVMMANVGHDDVHDNEHGAEEHGEEMHGGFMVQLEDDTHTASVTFTVTEEMIGEWELGCFLLDGVHYNSGMHGALVVTE